MNCPLVSIVIPSYKPAFFEQALKSAVGQTYPNTEIIVSDNCPTDAIEQICAKYSHIDYRRNPETGSGNVVSTLYAGTGEYIKPLFDDDILHPFCVEKMVQAMQTEREIELVFSASAVIDQSNTILLNRRPHAASGVLAGKDLQRQMVLNFANVVGEFSSVLYRRDRIEQFSPKELFQLRGQDYLLGLADVAAFINLSSGKLSYYCDAELSYFRRDAALPSNSNPQANPHFVYCVTDWVDLLLASCEMGVISLDELIASRDMVSRFMDSWKNTYPVTDNYKLKYEQSVQLKSGAA